MTSEDVFQIFKIVDRAVGQVKNNWPSDHASKVIAAVGCRWLGGFKLFGNNDRIRAFGESGPQRRLCSSSSRFSGEDLLVLAVHRIPEISLGWHIGERSTIWLLRLRLECGNGVDGLAGKALSCQVPSAGRLARSLPAAWRV